MKTDFSVTYEIWNEESAEIGDTDERGFISENVCLRDALSDLFETRTCHVDDVQSIESDCYPSTGWRWVTVYNGMEYLTGDYEQRALHIPDRITEASRQRLLRLILS